jgi:hypothetical protein
MDSIEDNLDILKMYKFQKKELESKEYQEYIDYLEIYFSKSNKKDEKYIREYLDGNYILIDKKNPKKKITITPSKFINIMEFYNELKKYSEEILYKISNLIESKNNITEENRKEFDYIKKKYLLFRKNINDIELINREYLEDLDNLLKKKIEKSYELAKFYQRRKEDYIKFSIVEKIEEKIKNKLIKKFSENNKKIPSDSDINKIAKEYKIPSIQIESIFKWIESSYYYILVKKEINDINDEIKEKEINFNKDIKNMIIKKPIIEK